MSEIQQQSANLSAEQKQAFEAAVERFEQAWHGPLRPSIADFLPAPGPLRDAILRELVQIDLEFRRRRGETAAEADYRKQFPDLAPTPPSVDASLRATISRSQESTGAFIERGPSADSVTGRFGRYEILMELGKGAMGAVYLAHDTHLDRRVALKIPKFSADQTPGLLDRFHREARAAANLRHPYLCPVYDVGEIDGQHYITMAYIEGRPLKDFSRATRPQPERRIAAVIRKIALGLAHAHAQGVIHRDLKPANVMIDAQGEPVVMDFGLARRTAADDVQATQDGAILGTPAYMSPEQASGEAKHVGPEADIYSLGVICYELLAGRLPFSGAVIALLKQIVLDEPPPPGTFRPGLDPQLEAICLKMMAKRPADRYRSMDEVAQALGEYIKSAGKDEPAEASPGAGVDESESHLLLPLTADSQTVDHPQPTIPASAAPAAAKAALGGRVPPWRRRPVVLTALGSFAAIAMLLGLALYFRTPDGGTLKITIEVPDVEVRVKGTKIILKGADPQKIVLQPGEKTFVVERGVGPDAFRFETTSLVLAKGETVTARVELYDDKIVRLVADGKEMGRAPQQTTDVKPNATPTGGDPAVGPDAPEPPSETPLRITSSQVLRGHQGAVSALLLDPRHNRLISGGDSMYKIIKGNVRVNYPGSDNSVRIWNLDTLEQIALINSGLGQSMTWPVRGLTLSPDGSQFAVVTGRPHAGYNSPTVTVWSIDGKQRLHHFPLDGRPGVWTPWFRDDGDALYTLSSDTVVHEFDLQTDRQAPTFKLDAAADEFAVQCVCASADGRRIFGGGMRDTRVRQWSLADRRLVQEYSGHVDQVETLAISPDQKYLASASIDGTARVWEISSGRALAVLRHETQVLSVAFCAAGQQVVTGGADARVVRWSVAGEKRLATYEGHTDAVRSLIVSPDGRRLFTGSADKTVRVWDLEPGNE